MADYLAYLLGIIRSERGRVDAGNECLRDMRAKGVIQ